MTQTPTTATTAALAALKADRTKRGDAARKALKQISTDLFAAVGCEFSTFADIAEEACAAAGMAPITVNMMLNFV